MVLNGSLDTWSQSSVITWQKLRQLDYDTVFSSNEKIIKVGGFTVPEVFQRRECAQRLKELNGVNR